MDETGYFDLTHRFRNSPLPQQEMSGRTERSWGWGPFLQPRGFQSEWEEDGRKKGCKDGSDDRRMKVRTLNRKNEMESWLHLFKVLPLWCSVYFRRTIKILSRVSEYERRWKKGLPPPRVCVFISWSVIGLKGTIEQPEIVCDANKSRKAALLNFLFMSTTRHFMFSSYVNFFETYHLLFPP